MSRVRDTAKVTVSEPVRGLRKARGKDRGQRVNSAVTTTTTHPLVWAAGKQIVANDLGYTRIEVVDGGTVIVR